MDAALPATRAEAIIQSSDDAILSKDISGVITSWNPGAERLYGYSPDEAVGKPISILIPPNRQGEERSILDRILAGKQVDHYETERVCKDGRIVAISLSVSPIRGEDGQVSGASVIARDITERRRATDRAEGLQRLTAALSLALSVDRAAKVLTEEGVPALGADAATVGMLGASGEEVELIASHGYTETGLAGWQSFPLAADLPMCTAIRTGEPVWTTTAKDLLARFPALAGADVRFASLGVVPLVVEGRAFGAAAFSFKEERDFTAEERAFMVAATQQAANNLHRASRHEEERQAREQLAFIARAAEVLGQGLDLDATLQRLADIAVPHVADWCGVDLATDTGFRSVAVAHADPEKVALAVELRERYPTDPDAPTGVPNVLRTGEPELYPEIPEELLEQSAQDEEHLATMRALGIESGMVVPLKAHGVTLGAISFVAAESGRRYDEDDLAFAQELASHAALAIDNARRYREEHDAAVTLQRALLPSRLPEVAGMEFAARYVPAGPRVEAGGDWYDVIERGDGGVDVVIGDVSGRGIPAASIMGRLRTAIHAYAVDRLGPSEVAERVSRVMLGFEESEMATLFLASVGADGRGEFIRAGHPPALVRDPDGSVRELLGNGSPPLGVLPDMKVEGNALELAPGSVMLLYTDGLIERRDETIDVGIERLKEALAGAPQDLEAALDAILAGAKPTEAEDDVAILALRIGS